MKRRDFLKKLGVVCGAAVTCPTELLESKPAIAGIDCSKPVKWEWIEISIPIRYNLHTNHRQAGFILHETPHTSTTVRRPR